MEAPHILIVYGQVKYGSCAAIVAERCLAIMSSDNLLYQIQPQNMGCVESEHVSGKFRNIASG